METWIHLLISYFQSALLWWYLPFQLLSFLSMIPQCLQSLGCSLILNKVNICFFCHWIILILKNVDYFCFFEKKLKWHKYINPKMKWLFLPLCYCGAPRCVSHIWKLIAQINYMMSPIIESFLCLDPYLRHVIQDI